MMMTFKWMATWTMKIHGMEISFLALWSDVDPSVHLPAPPAWVDRLADSVELQCLCNMGVLMKEEDYKELVHSKLTNVKLGLINPAVLVNPLCPKKKSNLKKGGPPGLINRLAGT